jgi:predicted metal-binding membrane protein
MRLGGLTALVDGGYFIVWAVFGMVAFPLASCWRSLRYSLAKVQAKIDMWPIRHIAGADVAGHSGATR